MQGRSGKIVDPDVKQPSPWTNVDQAQMSAPPIILHFSILKFVIPTRIDVTNPTRSSILNVLGSPLLVSFNCCSFCSRVSPSSDGNSREAATSLAKDIAKPHAIFKFIWESRGNRYMSPPHVRLVTSNPHRTNSHQALAFRFRISARPAS